MNMGMNIKNSLFYKVLKMEHEEIERLKWIESEKAGHDIGWNHAWFIWTRKHKSLWMRRIYASGVKKNLTNEE
jgi:hypothetical protein